MSKSNKEILDDIESLCIFFKKAIHDPKHSNRAGEIYTLFKQLNKVLSS